MGTANDFARRMQLPLELTAACRLAVHGARLVEMELGWMGERPFVNVASVGLPAPAARTAKAWKRPLGTLGYAAGAVVAGGGLSRHRRARRMRCDRALLRVPPDTDFNVDGELVRSGPVALRGRAAAFRLVAG